MNTSTHSLSAADAHRLERLESIAREVGSFSELHEMVQSLNGLTELLTHTLTAYEMGHTDSINWTVVVRAMDPARRQLAKVYAATSQLADMENYLGVLARQGGAK